MTPDFTAAILHSLFLATVGIKICQLELVLVPPVRSAGYDHREQRQVL